MDLHDAVKQWVPYFMEIHMDNGWWFLGDPTKTYTIFKDTGILKISPFD